MKESNEKKTNVKYVLMLTQKDKLEEKCYVSKAHIKSNNNE